MSESELDQHGKNEPVAVEDVYIALWGGLQDGSVVEILDDDTRPYKDPKVVTYVLEQVSDTDVQATVWAGGLDTAVDVDACQCSDARKDWWKKRQMMTLLRAGAVLCKEGYAIRLTRAKACGRSGKCQTLQLFVTKRADN